jgi:hypothetical protein
LNGANSSNASAFPRPGQSNIDDNSNMTLGVNETDSSTGQLFPTYFQPLDYYGAGSWLALGTNGLIPNLVPPPIDAGSAARFLQYFNYQPQSNANVMANYGTLGVYQGLLGGGYLSQSPYTFAGFNNIVDEPYEVVVDPRYQQASDQIFTYDEMSGLHLAQTDYVASLGQSRLRQLASFNFDLNQQASLIRKRFTTGSWDRRQHGFAYNAYRPWEYGLPPGNVSQAGNTITNNWDGSNDASTGNPSSQFPPMVDPAAITNGSQPIRNEVAALIGARVHNAQFNAAGVQSFAGAFNTPAYDFPNSVAGMDVLHQQSQLNINRLLTTANPGQIPSPTNPLRFRELTPHPTALQWQNAGANASVALPNGPFLPYNPATFSNPVIQEWWARYDRQLMARDIYVMLYLFGGGQDVNYANPAAGPPLYNNQQLKEMAQFAVNVVDALDRDDTITVFEYDVNLANGWGLDDNPMTNDGGDRAVVYGVEMQTLALSEAMIAFFKNQGAGNDITITPFDDSIAARYFTYIELMNVSPVNVDLQSAGANGAWRIQMQSSDLTSIPNPRSVRIKKDGLNPGSNTIASSGRFVISNVGRDDGGVDTMGGASLVARGSDLRISCNDNGATFDLLAPNDFEASAPDKATSRPPNANIDLVQDRDYGTSNNNGTFTLTEGAAGNLVNTQGGLLNMPSTPGANTLYSIVLQRRANINRPTPSTLDDTDADNSDNPWITVDRIGTVDPTGTLVTAGLSVQNVGLASGDTSASVATKLQNNMKSSERKWILDATMTNLQQSSGANTNPDLPAPNVTAAQANAMNTLSRMHNSVQAATPTPWQPHFDRDFSSVMELLSVPLYGPDALTTSLTVNGLLAAECNTNGGTTPDLNVTAQMTAANYSARVAQAKFFRPQHPSNVGVAPGSVNAQLDNRWHRILELLEVPTVENMQVNNFLIQNYSWLSPNPLQRAPGRMNLNGMRYPENLFALLDDPSAFNLLVYQTDGAYADRLEAANRNWWQQLLAARDGADPQVTIALGGVNAYLPGSPASRPIRSYSFCERNADAYLQYPPGTTPIAANQVLPTSVDDTLLRGLPLDGISTVTAGSTTLDQRQLFEARNNNDRTSSGSGNSNTVDYYTRNRLLSKIAGNTTNRSNVFIVWISIGFFDGYQFDAVNAPNLIQIGGQQTDQTTRRGFFIVDRSVLEDAWNATTGTYDFRKFVQYRKIIQ